MDFPKFQELVTNRTGFAQMPDPTATGEYFSDSCGDMYTIYLKVGEGERIEDISYFTTGCGFGVATCAILTELAKGKTVSEAAAIGPAEIALTRIFFGANSRASILVNECSAAFEAL